MEIKLEDLKILYNAEQIQKRIKEIAKELNEYYNDNEVIAICVLKGAVVFATDLIRNLNLPIKLEFIRLSSYGASTKTSGEVKAINLDLPNLNNKNVLIIEDIVDSGITAGFLIDYINNKFQVKTLKLCSLLNKKIMRKVNVDPDYYGFEIDDKFVVGFGLDYNESFRNLPYIAYKS